MRFWIRLAMGAAWCCAVWGTDFYVSPSGSDAAPGTRSQPWRSLARANRQDFHPGDRLLLAGGATFAGALRLDERDSGVEGRPVTVASYGQGPATIDGAKGRAVECLGCRYVAFRNLALRGAGRSAGNGESGLYVAGGSDVSIDGIDVAGFRKSGVEIDGVDRVRILHVRAHENGFAGISSGGRPSHDLYIGHSLVENNPGDPTIWNNHSGNGIVVGAVRGGVIEHCEARYNGWDMVWTGNGPVGIWAYESDRVAIQFCVSHHNRSTAGDGGAFDLDGGMTNSTLQYNYSHDNFGTGYLICQYEGAGVFEGNVVRYNISQDDGLLAHNSGIYVYVGGAGMKSAVVYNNTVVNTKGSAVALASAPEHAAEKPRFEFYNNLLVSRQAQVTGAGLGRFAGNLYWSVGQRGFAVDSFRDLAAWAQATGQEMEAGRVVGVVADPRLRRDGAALIDKPADLGALHEYELPPDSPACRAGLDLRARFGLDPGKRDFFGKPLASGVPPSIGAYDCAASGAARSTLRRAELALP